ncbi:hypothetical protein [Psychromonas sp.]|uniref:hypothetical protein n=1 Tax=Psychromonas sp. TaxID=1884585 RepID=UPI003565BD38
MDKETIRRGMQALSLVDQDVKHALIEFGLPAVRMRASGFEAFLVIIVSQQLSTKVATIIMQHLIALMQE